MQFFDHPFIVHFPIALAFITPILVVILAFMIKKNSISGKGWLIIVGLQLMTTATGYMALKTGGSEEEIVQRVVDKNIIHEHEEASEIFVGSTVLVLALSIAVFFIRSEIQFPIHLSIAALGLVSGYLAMNSGKMGAELVYEHGAASAYAQVIASPQEEPEGILPVSGEATTEASGGMEENESLKADENDYGNSDEIDEIEDDDSKQED